MTDYTVDADFKSRHRQHRVRRQVTCQYSEMYNRHMLRVTHIPIDPYLYTYPDKAGVSYGSYYGYPRYATPRFGGTLKRFAARASITVKGAKSLNDIVRADGRLYVGKDWTGMPVYTKIY